MTDPNERVSCEEALDRVERGWLDGPFQFDEEERLVIGEGPQLANPACRLGVQQGKKLRAVDDLKRRQTNRAAAIRAPVNLPTWGHFAAVIRTSKENGMKENLAMAKVEHMDAYRQLTLRNDQKMLAVVTLKGPVSGEMDGFIPQTAVRGNGSCSTIRHSFARNGDKSGQTVEVPAPGILR